MKDDFWEMGDPVFPPLIKICRSRLPGFRGILFTFLFLLAMQLSIGVQATEGVRQITVFVYLPSSITWTTGSATLKINGLATSELTRCSYAKVRLPAGIHRIEVAWNSGFFEGNSHRTPIDILLPMLEKDNYYLGYYPYALSSEELAEIFIDYRSQNRSTPLPGYRDRVRKTFTYLGSVKPEIATKAIYKCDQAKTTQ